MTKDRALLESQLAQALTGGDAFEIAVLCGLLARYCQGTQPSNLPGGFLPSLADINAVVDRLYDLDAEDPVELRYAVLAEFDEICAGHWMLGHSERMHDPAVLVQALFNGFPADWRDLSELASAVLQKCPPRNGDPARLVWRALEATRWPVEPVPEARMPRCEDALRRLGLA